MKNLVHAAKPTLNYLSLQNVPIFQQLQIEEALLRADESNWCILNYGSTPAIVMGISGIPEQLINFHHLKTHDVPVIRRFSGGGTVFVDHHTFFATWICNAEDVKAACYPQEVHSWTSLFYQQAFPRLNMGLRENDYVIGEKKWGGNAQYFRKGRWLHHTSMLWDYSHANMQCLLMPAKTPSYRQQRDHADFLCRLKEHFSELNHMKAGIEAVMQEKFSVRKISLEEVSTALQRPHRKATVLLDPTNHCSSVPG